MKIKELITKLQKENQEAEVYLSSDAEGNSFSLADEGLFVNIKANALVIYPIHSTVELSEL